MQHREGGRAPRSQGWGAFGLEMDAGTIAFMAVNFAAALADNTYMGSPAVSSSDRFWSSVGGWIKHSLSSWLAAS